MGFEAELATIGGRVWNALVGGEIASCTVTSREAGASEELVLGCVRIEGAWSGWVTAGASHELARRAAAKVQGVPEAELEPDDAEDLLAELANMIAGNFKALLPGPCVLSPPVVQKHSPIAAGDVGACLVFNCDAVCKDAGLRVRVSV